MRLIYGREEAVIRQALAFTIRHAAKIKQGRFNRIGEHEVKEMQESFSKFCAAELIDKHNGRKAKK